MGRTCRNSPSVTAKTCPESGKGSVEKKQRADRPGRWRRHKGRGNFPLPRWSLGPCPGSPHPRLRPSPGFARGGPVLDFSLGPGPLSPLSGPRSRPDPSDEHWTFQWVEALAGNAHKFASDFLALFSGRRNSQPILLHSPRKSTRHHCASDIYLRRVPSEGCLQP